MTRAHKAAARGTSRSTTKPARTRPEDAPAPAADDATRLAETADGRREAGEPEGPSADPLTPPVWDDRAG